MKRLYGLVCLLLSAAGALAAGHWSVNLHGFQYDMTVYATLQIGSEVVTDYGDYEVAAFSGDECRGVAKVLTTADGSKVLYLRIYSNLSQNETMRLKAYRPSKDEVVWLTETVDFVADSMLGTPGEPTSFTLETYLTGDATNDGRVNVTDIMAVANYILKINMDNFNPQAADVNGDGRINVTDIMGIANIILKVTPSSNSRASRVADEVEPQ